MYSLHSKVSWCLGMCPLYRDDRYSECPLMEVPLYWGNWFVLQGQPYFMQLQRCGSIHQNFMIKSYCMSLYVMAVHHQVLRLFK